ncbi:E3 ubiquitin-protein ligase TRIM45-like [Montipora capricornis]|uniref:E3 ubiquitin-protein ligase TRIM45-like n=1 Tax=Montipora capricornis TaxID=246305 RepID=UPI0035F1C58D
MDKTSATHTLVSKASPCCNQHPTDAVKFLCQTCNKMLCRTCVVHEGHRSHKYLSIANASAKERKAIQNNLCVTKQKLSGLRGSIFWVADMKKQVEARALEAEKEIDNLINQNIEVLERKQAQLKREVGLLCHKKVQQLEHQRETLNLALEEITTGVNYTEHVLNEMSDIEIITMKNQFDGLLDFNQVALQWEPCRTSNFSVEVDKSVAVEDIVDKMVHISDKDIQSMGQYVLTMLGGNSDGIFTSRCQQTSFFVVMMVDVHSRVNKVGVNLVEVQITQPGSKDPQKITIGNKTDSYTFCYCPNLQGTYMIQVSVAGQLITEEPIRWRVESAIYILDTECAVLPPQVYDKEKESLTGCWFKLGRHSWQVRILAPDKLGRSPDSPPFEVGVTDGNRTWRWIDGKKYYPNSSALVSTMSNWQCGDLLLFYLDLDFKQLVIYNQHSNEMDTWDGISVPIRPYINPPSAVYFGVQ